MPTSALTNFTPRWGEIGAFPGAVRKNPPIEVGFFRGADVGIGPYGVYDKLQLEGPGAVLPGRFIMLLRSAA